MPGALLRKCGYQFVSLGEALNGQAYSSPDTFISGDGASYIDHGALTRGKPEPAELNLPFLSGFGTALMRSPPRLSRSTKLYGSMSARAVVIPIFSLKKWQGLRIG